MKYISVILIIIITAAFSYAESDTNDYVDVHGSMRFHKSWINVSPATFDSVSSNWYLSAQVIVPPGHNWTNITPPAIIDRAEFRYKDIEVSDTDFRTLLGDHYDRQRSAIDHGDTLLPGPELKSAFIHALDAKMNDGAQ